MKDDKEFMTYQEQRDLSMPAALTEVIQDQNNYVLPIISVFSGAGGMDAGFHQAGFQTIFSADNNTAAVKTFNSNFAGEVSQCVDLSKTYVKKFMELIGGKAPGIQAKGIIGGPPCQGVSRGNSKSKSSDPRNKMMTTYTRLLNALEDTHGIDFFVFENVPGLRAEKNSKRYKSLTTALKQRFVVYEQVLNAVNFGVPQVRERLFIVGINKKHAQANNFTFPIGIGARRSVREAIEHMPIPTFFKRNLCGENIPHHPNHWTMNPKSVRFLSPNRASTGRSFRRLNWDEPSYTVAYGNREIHVHPNGTRRLSIYEAMILQGFQPHFRMYGNLSEQVTQVSNAVAPPVAFAIASSIKQLLYPGII
jgi:DNA (cytosine-5)-methyltransferase 1